MDNGVDFDARLLKQFCDRSRIADVDVVMFVTANIRNQIVANSASGSFFAKKFCPHVVVDPNNASAVLRKSPDRFRANQSGRTGNDHCSHSDNRRWELEDRSWESALQFSTFRRSKKTTHQLANRHDG